MHFYYWELTLLEVFSNWNLKARIASWTDVPVPGWAAMKSQHTSFPKACLQYSLGSWTHVARIYFDMSTSVAPEHANRHTLRLGMALRFLRPSSWALIIAFSSWYSSCGAVQIIWQSDSLYYSFSAMIHFSTFGISGQTCASSWSSNKVRISTHSVCSVIPTAAQPILQSNVFC